MCSAELNDEPPCKCRIDPDFLIFPDFGLKIDWITGIDSECIDLTICIRHNTVPSLCLSLLNVKQKCVWIIKLSMLTSLHHLLIRNEICSGFKVHYYILTDE